MESLVITNHPFLEAIPLVLAVVVVLLITLFFKNLRRFTDKIALSIMLACSMFMIVGQSIIWADSLTTKYTTLGTLVSLAWTAYDSMMLIAIILIIAPRLRKK
jgi:TRAP-type C4-dicarboxylate transport system permease small subunit